MLLCAISNRILLAGSEPERTEQLVALTASWAAAGLDVIQIRERDLAEDELVQLATRIVQAVRACGGRTRVVVNGPPARACAIALQAGADGVHLFGGLDPVQLAAAVARIREDWQSQRGSRDEPAISVSCHAIAEIVAARAAEATLALFAPVFEKVLLDSPALVGRGLKSLEQACKAARKPGPQPALPVLALGGVTVENTADCLAAGAAGIAAIRLFLSFGERQDWRRFLLPQRFGHVPVPP